MATADVTVMGGGIFGLSIAFACARRGAKVHLIEMHKIGAGSSGGVVGALAPHQPENWNAKKEFQLQSLLMAEGFWAEVKSVSGIDPGYGRQGRLQPLADTAALTQAERRSPGALELWKGRANWQVEHVQDAWRGSSPTGAWIRDSLSARLHPREACKALAAAVEALGGEVTEMHSRPDRDQLREPPAGIFSDRKCQGPVIWATGVDGLGALSGDFGRHVGGGVKGQAALFACDARNEPQLFVDGLHIVPHFDGTTGVGSTSERVYDDPYGTDDALEALIDKARNLCPALQDAPVMERWAGVRPRAISLAPILGDWPARPGHFIANGGFKIGFGMAPKIAEVMADLVLNGKDTIPDGFRLGDCL